MNPILVVDLLGQYTHLKDELDAAVQRVLSSGWYILGQEVAAFEEEFAAYHSAKLPKADQALEIGCVGVNSGTDALHLALRACEIGAGDEVITVAHTAVATVAAIRSAGATPVLVDIDPATYTIDPAAAEAAITPRTKAIIPVHIYGQPADMDALLALGTRHHLRVIEDCAQAHGALYRGRPVGTMGDLGCFSFYPTKNLGALGDGGAVISRNPALVEQVRLLREYGWTPQSRYVSQAEGVNSRLDEMQAAMLRVKLQCLDEWNEIRRACAALYAKRLPTQINAPVEDVHSHHVYHLYVVRLAARNRVRQALSERGIGSGIHYPVPVHMQPAYQGDQIIAHAMPETERAAGEILSLPMHPLLTVAEVERVANALAEIHVEG